MKAIVKVILLFVCLYITCVGIGAITYTGYVIAQNIQCGEHNENVR